MNWSKGLSLVVALMLVSVPVARVSVGSEMALLHQLDVEVSIVAHDEQDGIYECTAVLRDLESKAVVSTPKMLFKAGEEAQMRSGTSPGLDVLIVVSVNEEETEARYEASVFRGESLVSSQRVKVVLGS